MDSQLQHMTASSSLNPKTHKFSNTKPSWVHQYNSRTSCISIQFRISSIRYHAFQLHHQKKLLLAKVSSKKPKNGVLLLSEEPIKVPEKKGTITGAVALIIGTSIGSGILALPQKASQAGLVPSSISLVVCWAFLLIEALLLVEINVRLRREKMKKEEDNELEVISLRTMAQETLGDWGGTIATSTYVFLSYTSMVAYSSKAGEILFNLINLPAPVSGFSFTLLFTMLIFLGGSIATDKVNQLLTSFMIGLLLAIEVVAVVSSGWSGLAGTGNWEKVPPTLPVIIFSLVYHDLAPVLCAYLGSDLKRLRVSVVVGSIVPLIALLVWDAIALSLTSQTDQAVDPVELLMSVKWSGVSYMVEAFSLLAIGTSIIGTLLGFYEFFKEQLTNVSWNSTPKSPPEKKANMTFGIQRWWGRNKTSFTAMAIAIAPSLIVSTTVPDAFSASMDISGGYCMTMLYGILPPAMAWAMHSKEGEGADQQALSRARPLLLGVGLFACGIVVEQILQDMLALQS